MAISLEEILFGPGISREFEQHRQAYNKASCEFSPGILPLDGQGGSSHAVFPEEKETAKAPSEIQLVSYLQWCSKLTKLVLRTRTTFSAFLHLSIRISKSSRPRGRLAPTFFPIPVPLQGIFDRMTAAPSQKKRISLSLNRAVHVISMAMNFWHFGGDFREREELWQTPNSMHRKFYGFVRSIIKSDGLSTEFDMLRSGRRNPELFARLFDLVEFFKAKGCSAGPYDRAFQGYEVPRDEFRFPELQPYRDLDPARLKVTGRGHWDISNYLTENLLMAYKEPLILKLDRTPQPWEYPRLRDDQETVFKLAQVWDKNGLLLLHRDGVDERRDFQKVRIFNAYKSKTVDRQIGDRRGMNAVEAVIKGPSNNLPAGADLCDVVVDTKRQRLSISISDRKDYYHQIQVTRQRAVSNTLGPGLPEEWLEGLDAYGVFLLRAASKKRYDRLRDGDQLGQKRYPRSHTSGSLVWAAFNSVLQGDHCGVDLATEAHTQLLQDFGLLRPGVQLTANKPCRHSTQFEGLVIDDFFSVSVEPQCMPADQAAAVRSYHLAQQAYEAAGLQGSPDKDKCGVDEGRTIGAYLNSAHRALSRGVCTVGAPVEKRLSLAALSLQLAQLPLTTYGLHSCVMGAWVSMMIYRHPMMSLFDAAFRLVAGDEAATRNQETLPLPRKVAQELTLAAVLSPLMLSNIGAQFDEFIYATDASEEKGAICRAKVSRQLQEVLFRSCRTKGAYTRLLSPVQALLTKINEYEEVGEEKMDLPTEKPGRPLAFVFEFLEIFSGASGVTEFVSGFGVVCGPPIDISISEEYNMKEPHLVAWVTHLLAEGTLKAVLLMPPCTTFSIMRRPALRDKFFPFGYDPSDPQTEDGNILAHRSFQIGFTAAANGAIAVLEKPHSSKMKYLPSWEVLCNLAAASLVRSDSCQFGSIHRKSFSFLGINVDLQPIALRCPGTCNHVQIQGAYTKAATYVPRLAYGLAHCIADGVLQIRKHAFDAAESEGAGLESQLVNEVMLTSEWEVLKAWSFKAQSHINLLELKSAERLVETQVKRLTSMRFLSLVDSNVSRGALGKGRSASRAVMAILRRINSTLVAGDLYMVNPFCPTRLNVADDPTRDRDLRPSSIGLSAFQLSQNQLYDLACLPRLRRWASNWARLLILLSFPSILQWGDRSLYRRTSIHQVRPGFQHSPRLDFSCMDFDSTLGYPGEGPLRCYCPRPGSSLALWIFLLAAFFLSLPLPPSWVCPCLFFFLGRGCSLSRWPCFAVGCLVSETPPAEAMVLGPQTGHEFRKAEERALRPGLPEGRVTLEVTNRLRERYWKSFLEWCQSEGLNFEVLLREYHLHVDEINLVLTKYGRLLYTAGKPYTIYAETINMLTSKKPVLRRQLQGAWDLAFNWVQAEPSAHHIAMPWQVLLSLLSVSLLWGWVDVAGCIALGWGALLRAGEIFAAKRQDLLLPRDVDETILFAILSIHEPKTRHSGPRHQAAKLDAPDLLQVVDLAFGEKTEGTRLWEKSGQTLRMRFKELLRELRLPLEKFNGMKPLDLGSLRAGGATWHLQITENSEYCRRKGRWINMKTMEIYVQETTSILYLKRIPSEARTKVLTVANLFPKILQRSIALQQANVPKNVWYALHNQEDLWR